MVAENGEKEELWFHPLQKHGGLGCYDGDIDLLYEPHIELKKEKVSWLGGWVGPCTSTYEATVVDGLR